MLKQRRYWTLDSGCWIEKRQTFILRGTDGRILFDVEGSQFFAKDVFLKDVGQPVGEIVRRFGRKRLVLLDEMVSMVVNDRSRRGLDVLEEFGAVAGLAAGKYGEVETAGKMECFCCLWQMQDLRCFRHGTPP